MKNTELPRDGSSEAIPVLGFKKAGSQTVISNAGGTAVNTNAFTQKVVTVTPDVNVRMAQGKTNAVTALATDAKLFAGMSYDISTFKNGEEYPFMAFRTDVTAATVDISERE